MRFATGTYTGDDAATQEISLPSGFGTPDFVGVKANDASNYCAWGMRAAYYDTDAHAWYFGYDWTDAITAYGTDSFTVGDGTGEADSDLNESPVVFHYIALRDDGNGDIAFGKYTGNGAVSPGQTVSLPAGFGTPACVWILSDTYQDEAWKPDTAASAAAHCFHDRGSVASLCTLGTDQFQADGRVNLTDVQYAYVAFKDVAGVIEATSYVGDGADNRTVATSAGVTCEFVMLENLNSGNPTLWRAEQTGGHTTDDCSVFNANANPGAGFIQSFESGTFTVGDAGSQWWQNRNTVDYRAFWFKDNPVGAGSGFPFQDRGGMRALLVR
jgi:hypothetical protein